MVGVKHFDKQNPADNGVVVVSRRIPALDVVAWWVSGFFETANWLVT
jgi:uncharacterized membrane protein